MDPVQDEARKRQNLAHISLKYGVYAAMRWVLCITYNGLSNGVSRFYILVKGAKRRSSLFTENKYDFVEKISFKKN